MESTQVRYGRNRHGQRCSALVTMRVGDEICFGLSKCHSKNDRWDKEFGRKLAAKRAYIALQQKDLNKEKWRNLGNLTVQKSGLFGVCPVDSAKQLMQYFRESTQFLEQVNQ